MAVLPRRRKVAPRKTAFSISDFPDANLGVFNACPMVDLVRNSKFSFQVGLIEQKSTTPCRRFCTDVRLAAIEPMLLRLVNWIDAKAIERKQPTTGDSSEAPLREKLRKYGLDEPEQTSGPLSRYADSPFTQKPKS